MSSRGAGPHDHEPARQPTLAAYAPEPVLPPAASAPDWRSRQGRWVDRSLSGRHNLPCCRGLFRPVAKSNPCTIPRSKRQRPSYRSRPHTPNLWTVPQRREHHEYIGHAVALVFVIVPGGSSGLGGDRRARLDDQLLGGFIQTDQRTIGIPWFLIGFQHVFHRGDEAGVGVRRDHPLPLAVRFDDVFFRVLPIVLSLAFSTMFNSTIFSSSRRRLQRANPSGAGEQAWAINFASIPPSKIRGRAEVGLCLRFSAPSSPSSTRRRRRRPILLTLVSSASEIALSAPTLTGLRYIRLQQDARLRQQLCRVLAHGSHRLEPLALLDAQLHHILLD